MNAFELLKNISLFASVTTVVLGVVCLIIAISNSSESSLFIKYLLLCAFTEIVNLYGAYAKIETLMIIPFFSFFELLIFVNYFKTQFAAKKLNIILLLGGLLALVDAYLIYNNERGNIFVVSRVCNSIILIGLAIFSIYSLELPKRFVRVNFGIILYFALTFIQFLLLNLLINVKENEIFIIWITYSLACVVFNFLLFFDSWKFGKIHKL